jgi:hypothetical protein
MLFAFWSLSMAFLAEHLRNTRFNMELIRIHTVNGRSSTVTVISNGSESLRSRENTDAWAFGCLQIDRFG